MANEEDVTNTQNNDKIATDIVVSRDQTGKHNLYHHQPGGEISREHPGYVIAHTLFVKMMSGEILSGKDPEEKQYPVAIRFPGSFRIKRKTEKHCNSLEAVSSNLLLKICSRRRIINTKLEKRDFLQSNPPPGIRTRHAMPLSLATIVAI